MVQKYYFFNLHFFLNFNPGIHRMIFCAPGWPYSKEPGPRPVRHCGRDREVCVSHWCVSMCGHFILFNCNMPSIMVRNWRTFFCSLFHGRWKNWKPAGLETSRKWNMFLWGIVETGSDSGPGSAAPDWWAGRHRSTLSTGTSRTHAKEVFSSSNTNGADYRKKILPFLNTKLNPNEIRTSGFIPPRVPDRKNPRSHPALRNLRAGPPYRPACAPALGMAAPSPSGLRFPADRGALYGTDVLVDMCFEQAYTLCVKYFIPIFLVTRFDFFSRSRIKYFLFISQMFIIEFIPAILSTISTRYVCFFADTSWNI